MIYDSLNKPDLPVNTHVYVGATESEVLQMKRRGLITGYTKQGVLVANTDGIIRTYYNWMECLAL